MPEEFSIGPATKVFALLEQYPALEDVLIGMAPPFKKLRNPILRNSVAKIASLKQASVVGGVPLTEMLNTLREAVGQSPLPMDDTDHTEDYLGEAPDWFDASKVVASLNEEDTFAAGKMPVTEILQALKEAESSDIVALETTFLPAPGIDALRAKGLRVWCRAEGAGAFRTFVAKGL